MKTVLAIGFAAAVTDAQAAGSAQGSMRVGATVMAISCPVGRNVPSCIKPLETSSQVPALGATSARGGGNNPHGTENVVGEIVFVTLTY